MNKFVSTVCLMLLLTVYAQSAEKTRPNGSVPLSANEVVTGGDILKTIVSLVSLVDKDIKPDTVSSLVKDADNDPNYNVYYFKTANPDMTKLSENSARLNGSVLYTDYAVKRSNMSMKKAARSFMASETAISETNDSTLTPEEIKILKSKASQFSDDQRKEMKSCFILLTCGSLAIATIKEKAPELQKSVESLAKDPGKLASNPFDVPLITQALDSSRVNLTAAVSNSPKVIKETVATIAILKAILTGK